MTNFNAVNVSPLVLNTMRNQRNAFGIQKFYMCTRSILETCWTQFHRTCWDFLQAISIQIRCKYEMKQMFFFDCRSAAPSLRICRTVFCRTCPHTRLRECSRMNPKAIAYPVGWSYPRWGSADCAWKLGWVGLVISCVKLGCDDVECVWSSFDSSGEQVKCLECFWTWESKQVQALKSTWTKIPGCSSASSSANE